jgi:hypothetical protein
MEIINKISMIQKKTPNTTAAPSSACFSSLFVTVVGAGGNKAKKRNEKNKETINKGIQAMPQPIGPNGVIHNCPVQVLRKIMRITIHRPRIGLLENKEKINTMNKVTRNAAGII